MYTLSIKQAQQSSGGVFDMSAYQMQVLTIMTSVGIQQIFSPLAMSAASIKSESTSGRILTNILSITATAVGFVAGNNFFPEPEKTVTAICLNVTK